MTMPDVDLETCSWCVLEVPESTLMEVRGGDGARLCKFCQDELVEAALPGTYVSFFR